jgi:putative hemolysin
VLEIEEAFPEEDLGGYHTLGGFAMLQLERVPAVGDKFTWNGIQFEIVDMDRHRVDKLLVQRLPSPAAERAP